MVGDLSIPKTLLLSMVSKGYCVYHIKYLLSRSGQADFKLDVKSVSWKRIRRPMNSKLLLWLPEPLSMKSFFAEKKLFNILEISFLSFLTTILGHYCVSFLKVFYWCIGVSHNVIASAVPENITDFTVSTKTVLAFFVSGFKNRKL